MIYLDTSALMAMHTHEVSTPAVLAWYGQLDATPICSATWCITEFASALSIKQRTGQATAK
jgi:predicted nucleic acid-binding protein